jgi:hypothetical protein
LALTTLARFANVVSKVPKLTQLEIVFGDKVLSNERIHVIRHTAEKCCKYAVCFMLGAGVPLNHSSEFAELTDRQYMMLGKAVVEWANIEQLLSILLGRLLATPDFLARTFTDPLAAVRLQSAIQEAVEIHRVRYEEKVIAGALLDDIIRINQSVTALRTIRNRIAHFCWCRYSDESLFGTSFAGGISTPKSERKNVAVITLTELTDFHQDAFALVEQLIALTEKLPAIDEGLLLALRPTGAARNVAQAD